MAIVVPDQGQVDMGRSRISPRETYVSAPKQGGDSGLDDLARALGNFAGIYDHQQKKKEEEDLRRLDYYTSHANSIRKDINEGGPIEAQLGNILPDQSPTVRARVAEKLGQDDGAAWAHAQYQQLFSDPAALISPEEVQKRMEAIRSQAHEKAKNQPDYGNGFVRSVEAQLNQYANQTAAQRTAYFTEKQAEAYTEQSINKAETAKAGAPVMWRSVDTQRDKYKHLPSILPKGKSGEHIGKVKVEFADRLESALDAMPPELRKTMQINSGYRSTERQAELFAEAVQKYGSEKAARKHVAPPGKSNHNHGEAFDLAAEGKPAREFANTAAGKWLHANAERFGLYFPMGHEPWHVEMRGGRREGSKNHRPDVHDTDGEDIGPDVRTAYINRIIGAESNGNPTARNPRSSAAGLGQFTDSTWLAEAREANPALKGKSDAEVLRLKTDSTPEGVAFQKQVVGQFTDKNIKRLEQAGIPVTEGNIYAMHFLGEGAGPKVLKARGGTRMDTLVSPETLAANPFLSGMTVSEFREWSADKMGNATNDVSRARNAIRATDREWSQTSSLANQYRSELAAKGLMQRAIQTMDTKYLDMLPPEFVTPAMRAQLAATRKQVIELQDKEYVQQRQREAMKKQDLANAMIDDMNLKIANGEDIDPRQYANNPTAFEYAMKMRDVNLRLSDTDSKYNATVFTDDVFNAATTGDYSKLKGLSPEIDEKIARGETPTQRDFLNVVRSRTDLLPKDKQALIANMDKITAGASVVRDPIVQDGYRTRLAPLIDTITKAPEGMMFRLLGIPLENIVKTAYDASIKRQTLAYISEKGSPPTAAQMDVFINTAISEASEVQKRTMELVKSGQANEATVGQKLTELSGGKPQAQPQAQPQGQPQAQPTEQPAAGAPREELTPDLQPLFDQGVRFEKVGPNKFKPIATEGQPKEQPTASEPAKAPDKNTQWGAEAVPLTFNAGDEVKAPEQPKEKPKIEITRSDDGGINVKVPEVTAEMVRTTLVKATAGAKPGSNAQQWKDWLMDNIPLLKQIANGQNEKDMAKISAVEPLMKQDPTYKSLLEKYNNSSGAERMALSDEIRKYQVQFAEQALKELNQVP
jgi:LAS superfamily LD-carboxypeptidase LdcB